jgi:hypothetical protein
MKRLCALVLIPALLGASCAARGARTALRSQDPPELWQQYVAKLPVGSAVRIATTDGDRFNATLLIVDGTGVTVKPRTRVPEPPRHVTFDHLTQLELQSAGSSPGDRFAAVGIGIATGAGVFLGSLFLLFALFGD